MSIARSLNFFNILLLRVSYVYSELEYILQNTELSNNIDIACGFVVIAADAYGSTLQNMLCFFVSAGINIGLLLFKRFLHNQLQRSSILYI